MSQLLPPKGSFPPGIQQGGDAPRFLLKSVTVAPSGKEGKLQAETRKSSCGGAKSKIEGMCDKAAKV